jgi:putative transposase
MPDHAHLVIQPRDALVDCIRRLKSVAWRRCRDRSGFVPRLWQAGFHDRGIRNERQLASAVEYVHQNPVLAGLVDNAEDWPWSSFREFWPVQ